MKNRALIVTTLALLIGAFASACGSSHSERSEVVREVVDHTTQPPPQVVVTTPTVAACVEEWVHMPVLINFPTGGAELDAQNRAILAEVVRTAASRQDIRRVRVEGHTDTCGAEASNIALSQQRAEVVAIALVEMGVAREMIETVGYGSQQPRANEACETRQGRAQTELSRQTNRRVEFSILVCRDGV